MVDQGKIDAYRPEAAADLSLMLAQYLALLDAGEAGEPGDPDMGLEKVDCDPRLLRIHAAQAEPDGADRLCEFSMTMEEPDDAPDEIWAAGLRIGLAFLATRAAKSFAIDLRLHDQVAHNLVGIGIFFHHWDADHHRARTWLVTDILGNAYQFTRIVDGPKDGLVDLVTGWIDDAWSVDDAIENAEDFGFRPEHIGLGKILDTARTDHDAVVDAYQRGVFDPPEPLCAVLAEALVAHAATEPDEDDDDREMVALRVAQFGYLPLLPEGSTTTPGGA